MNQDCFFNYEKNRPLRVVVAHPEKQHSFHLATALKRKGILYKYITTVYDSPKSLTSKFKIFLGTKDKKKADTRKCTDLDDTDIIQFYELLGLSFLFLQRTPVSEAFAYSWLRIINSFFSKKVAKYINEKDIDAIIMFDYTAENCFANLRVFRPDITRIMDVSIATRQYMKNNFENNVAVEELKRELPEIWNNNVMKGLQKEIDDSDYFLVASNMSKESLNYCGVKEDKVAIIPYGVDAQKFSYDKKKDSQGSPLKLIYVGQITHRKGIHHLLKVVSKFESSLIEVSLAGAYETSSPIYRNYHDRDNIHFHGFVTRDVLAEKYKEADLFVFPTIGEGYGLVLLEAMACGLPVLCSNLAGGNDAVIEGENGFVFEGGNDEQLYEKLKWFIEHRDEMKIMGIKARENAQKFTWDRYYEAVAETVAEMALKQF